MRYALALLLATAACRTTAPDPASLKDDPTAPGASVDLAAFVKERAHTSATATTPVGLYNVTVPGAEVDALPAPDGGGGGFEYWPFVFDEAAGNHPWPHPDLIQWGYGAGTEQAQKCMKLSFHIWKYVQENKPASLSALAEVEGAPSSYFQWNNDYTKARTEQQGFRNFWHYNRPNGLIKWISHTKMDGSCHHPTVEAIELWAACEIKKLKNLPGQCPGHR